MSANGGTLRVRIWKGGSDGRSIEFEAPQRANQTVLDVVTWIQRHRDPTLAYRFSCRVGMCGSCAMTVNGKPRWTCRTHVAKVAQDSRLTIGPLRNLPIVKDLVCDMTVFFDKWRDARGRFQGRTTRYDDIERIVADARGSSMQTNPIVLEDSEIAALVRARL